MKVFAVVLVLIGVLNFSVLVVTSLGRGGSADRDASHDGHFFVSDHGKLTEVSEGTYRFSLAHSKSVFITHAMAMLGIVLLMAVDMKKKAGRG